MRLERYELKSGEKLEVFEFVSVRYKGANNKTCAIHPNKL